ncbi:non-canonical purine NTP pyrophosphatase, partial [Klebsiella pneumoniae]
MQKVVLATGNAGKVRELASLLEDFGLDIVAQTELGVGAGEGGGVSLGDNPG